MAMRFKINNKSDLVLSVILLVFSAICLIETNSINNPGHDVLGPGLTPIITVGIIALLAVILLIKSFISTNSLIDKKQTTEISINTYGKRPWLALGVVLITIVYVLVMQFHLLRFWSATCLFIVITGMWMSKFNLQMVKIIVPLALVLGIGFHFLFTKIMIIDLP